MSFNYKRQVEAIARQLAPELQTEDPDAILTQLWRIPDRWEPLAKTWASVAGTPDDEKVAEDLAQAIAMIRSDEGSEIYRALADLGFRTIGTGGGCEAYQKTVTDEGHHILITDYECGLPGTWVERVVTAYYEPDGSPTGDDAHFQSMRALLEALRNGSPYPWLGKHSGPQRYDQEDLDLVNQHRRTLGMGPIDPSAGWTATEIGDMAENIRSTGRMANPKVLPLIEIPTRR